MKSIKNEALPRAAAALPYPLAKCKASVRDFMSCITKYEFVKEAT
jgi:hypothetical protein